MSKLNEELLDRIFNICEQKGCVEEIDKSHYEIFLGISDKDMEIIIRTILYYRHKDFNENIFSGRWKTNKDIYDYISLFLELIGRGIIKINFEKHEFVFYKPIEKYFNKDIEKAIDRKIINIRPIIKKVFENI